MMRPGRSPPSTAPPISRFFGITIAMYFDDHGHPHFHAWHADGTAKIRIDEIDVIEGDLKTRQLRPCSPGPSFTKPSC
jgi:hypothetical protein